MGYETSVCVLQAGCNIGKDQFHILISHFDLSKCDTEFNNLFTEPLDGFFYLPGNGNKEFREDCYGERAKVARLEEVYHWLGHEIFTNQVNGEPAYRRYKMLFKALEYFMENKEDWRNEEIKLVRYGH